MKRIPLKHAPFDIPALAGDSSRTITLQCSIASMRGSACRARWACWGLHAPKMT